MIWNGTRMLTTLQVKPAEPWAFYKEIFSIVQKIASEQHTSTLYAQPWSMVPSFGIAIISVTLKSSKEYRIEQQDSSRKITTQKIQVLWQTCLKELELPSLQERRKQLRLIFMFKVVEGLVPAMPSDQFFKPRNTNKRHIKTRKFENCVSNNLVERSATNNSKPYVVPRSFTDQFRNSFFVRTVNDWNQLEEDCVTSTTIEQFKKRISLRD